MFCTVPTQGRIARVRGRVSALSHFDDSGFADATGRAWTVGGSPTISSPGAFGRGAISTNGNSGYLVSQLSLDAPDWTVECFFRMFADGGSYTSHILQFGDDVSAAQGFALQRYCQSLTASTTQVDVMVSRFTPSAQQGNMWAGDARAWLSLATWYHVAVVMRNRQLFGVLDGFRWAGPIPYSGVNWATAKNFWIGRVVGSYGENKPQLIDELRIINGACLYEPRKPFAPPRREPLL